MRKILLILFLQFSFAQSLEVKVDSDQSYLSYHGNHPAHQWVGTSNQILGTFLFNQENPELSKVDLSVPVFSIDSRNSNRDSNMLDVIEDYFYPVVSFTSSRIEKKDNHYQVVGDLLFHGVKKEISLPVDLLIEEDRVIVRSNFEIRLSDYQIKRPSLLAIRINNVITIEFYLVGKL